VNTVSSIQPDPCQAESRNSGHLALPPKTDPPHLISKQKSTETDLLNTFDSEELKRLPG